MLTVEVETRRKVLNVGSGRGTVLNEFLAIIAEVTGERPEVEYVPGRAMDVPTNVLDVTRVREELARSPRTELAEGVARTWDWVRTLTGHSVEQEIRRGLIAHHDRPRLLDRPCRVGHLHPTANYKRTI